MMTRIYDGFPEIKGSIQENVNLGKMSFFGTGGNAEVLFIPEDMDDLSIFLKCLPRDVPVTILGSMSNVLIRSGGISGVVIILGNWFKKLFIEDNILEVGAAVSCSRLSSFAMDHDFGGFEFLMGIPGTVGGAMKMNAGCYGSEISDLLIEFEGIDCTGKIRWIGAEGVNFSYRASNIPDDLIITRAWFRGIPGVNYSVVRKTNEIVEKRKDTQPLGKKCCGSTFKNSDTKKAWELIDAAGCRGMRIGGAVVSEKHCNFIVNEHNATADDIEELGELVIKKVRETSGINLEWEVIRLGNRKK